MQTLKFAFRYFSILQKMCNTIYHYNEDQIVTVIASYFAYLPSTYRGKKWCEIILSHLFS